MKSQHHVPLLNKQDVGQGTHVAGGRSLGMAGNFQPYGNRSDITKENVGRARLKTYAPNERMEYMDSSIDLA